jgi:hypothetical protein
MAIKTLDDRTSITLIDDFSCKIEDIAIVNRMPVCNCSDAIKALEAAMTKICMNPQKKCFIKGTANTEATTKALKVSPEIEGGA